MRLRSAAQYVYRYEPACQGQAPGELLDGLACAQTAPCAVGEERVWVYRSAAAAVPRVWDRAEQQCILDEAVGGGAEVAVDFTAEDLARLPLPPALTVVEPAVARVVVNMETNAYAVAGQVVIPTQVLGTPVEVRASPVAFTFDYGDGAVLGPVTDPGGPYPVLTNAHVYTVPGEHAVMVTTTYAGEFSVAGGAWLPVEGTAEVASAPVVIEAVSVRSELVADLIP